MNRVGIFPKCTWVVLPLIFSLAACNKLRDAAKNLGKKAEEATNPQFAAQVTQLNDDNFESFASQRGKVAVIDFYADWCGPCRALSPVLDQIAAESKGLILIGKVNVDQNSQLSGKHGVRGIPDVRIFRDGKEVDRFVGAPPEKEVRKRIEVHATGLPPARPVAGQGDRTQGSITPATKDWLPPGVKRR